MEKESKAKENSTKAQIKSGKIKSRVNYDVLIKYENRDCILAPRQELIIEDFSKLSNVNPKEVLKIEN